MDSGLRVSWPPESEESPQTARWWSAVSFRTWANPAAIAGPRAAGTQCSGDGRFVVGSGRRNGKTEAFLADLSLNLEFTRTAGGLRLTWPGTFRLQRTRSLSPAAWEDVPGAISPSEIPTVGEPAFFRVVAAP